MKRAFLLGTLITLFLATTQPVFAASGPTPTTTPTATTAPAPSNSGITPPPAASNPGFMTPAAPDLPVKAYILMDANTGAILAEKNADERLAPASLTKLMTLYIVFKELAAGKIQLTDMVPVTEDAWRTGGSRMFIKVGTTVSVDDLLQGVIVASGNDATVALADYIGGTQGTFVQLMDQETQVLGMPNSHFTDPTGLPDPNHYSSARDLATLSRTIINTFPQYYHYFSEKWFTYNNIRQPNRNRLLWSNLNVDGLKTGHTDEAGFCLIASAKQGNMRLISVVLGATSDAGRASANQALLQYGFRFFQSQQLYSANQVVTTARVYGGQDKYVNVGVLQDVAVTLPINAAKNVTTTIQLNKPLKAPLTKGQQVGTVTLTANGNVVGTQALVALSDDPKGGWWRRFVDWLALLF